MSLVDDRKNSIISFHCVCNESGVLDHENVILGVWNDGGLVLGNLHQGQTVKLDDGVRHYRTCKIQRPWNFLSDKKILTSFSACPSPSPPVSKWECRIPPRFRQNLWRTTKVIVWGYAWHGLATINLPMVDKTYITWNDLSSCPVCWLFLWQQSWSASLKVNWDHSKHPEGLDSFTWKSCWSSFSRAAKTPPLPMGTKNGRSLRL